MAGERAGGDLDHQLLAAAAHGDEQAFRTLMAGHVKPALALAQRMIGESRTADEIVQEAFLRAWRMAPRWNPDRSTRFATWLYRVVVNLCLDHRRKPSLVPIEGMEELIDERPDGLAAVEMLERRRLVADALSALPGRQRAAITLFYFSEMSTAEASEVIETTIEGFESLLVRGRRGIRRYLAERGVDAFGDMM